MTMNARSAPDPGMSVNGFLAEFVKGKTVLDVGCVEHSASSEESEFGFTSIWFAAPNPFLASILSRRRSKHFRKRGYNMICADATTVSLDQTCDVIVAGELIEHLVNPGGLLSNMQRHLNTNGRLIITTPHPFYLLNCVVPLFSLQTKLWHPDHVAWYCPFLLESMLRKTGYDMEVCYYFNRSRKLRRLLRALHLPCFEFLGQSIVAIARPSA